VIHDLDRSIKELLTTELPDVNSNRVEVAFEPPNRDWRRTGPALNFFLYDVRENSELRQHQLMESVNSNGQPQRANGMVTRERTPLRIDCFYIVTAWGEAPYDEHMLLSQCMMALARYPVLNRHQLLQAQRLGIPANGSGNAPQSSSTTTDLDDGTDHFLQGNLRKEITYEIRTRVADHDVMTNPAEIWSSLENTMKAGFSYVVNLPLRPWEPFDTPMVESVQIRFTPPDSQYDPKRPTEDLEIQRSFGGTVRNIMNDRAIPDVDVYIENTGLQSTTDAEGRFYFDRVRFGDGEEFTLVANHLNAPTYRKTVKLPIGYTVSKSNTQAEGDDGMSDGFEINIAMALDKNFKNEQTKPKTKRRKK